MTIHLMYEPSAATTLEEATKYAQEIAGNHAGAIYFRFRDTLVRVEPTDEPDEIHQHWKDQRNKEQTSTSSHPDSDLEKRHEILTANSGALSRAYLRLRNIIGNMHNSPHGSEGAEAMYAFTEEELSRKLNELRDERDKAGRGYRRARGALQLVMNRLSEAVGEPEIDIEYRGTPAFQADMLVRLNKLIDQQDALELKCDELQHDVDGLMRTPFPTSLHAEIILQKVVDALAEANHEDNFKIVSWEPGMLEDWALRAIRSLKNESGLVTTNWTFAPDILQETYDALASQLEIPTVRVTTVSPMVMKSRLLKGIADLAQQRYDARIALLNMQGQRDEERATNKELVREHGQWERAIDSIRSQIDRTDAKGDTLDWKVCWLAEEYLRMQKLLQNSPHIEGALLTMQTQRDEAIEANVQSWTHLPKNQVDAIYNIMDRLNGLFGQSYWQNLTEAGPDPTIDVRSPWRSFRQHLMYLYLTWRAAAKELGYTFPDSSPKDGTDAR